MLHTFAVFLLHVGYLHVIKTYRYNTILQTKEEHRILFSLPVNVNVDAVASIDNSRVVETAQ